MSQQTYDQFLTYAMQTKFFEHMQRAPKNKGVAGEDAHRDEFLNATKFITFERAIPYCIRQIFQPETGNFPKMHECHDSIVPRSLFSARVGVVSVENFE
jgi:hypothetical protein